jgi:hypothetical protein
VKFWKLPWKSNIIIFFLCWRPYRNGLTKKCAMLRPFAWHHAVPQPTGSTMRLQRKLVPTGSLKVSAYAPPSHSTMPPQKNYQPALPWDCQKSGYPRAYSRISMLRSHPRIASCCSTTKKKNKNAKWLIFLSGRY